MRILVLGIGNILLSDEGVGPYVVNRLTAEFQVPEHVEVLDGGTSGMDLLDCVAAADAMVIVDCARLDEGPGAVREIVGEGVPAYFQMRISPHQIGLSDLLAAAALIDALPQRMALIAIAPENMELGLELSETGERAACKALETLVARLADWGAAPLARAEAA